MTTIDFRPLAIRGVSRIINLPVAGRPGLILTLPDLRRSGSTHRPQVFSRGPIGWPDELEF
jgi:hypothetical protein